jgi:hypothetical protein
MDLFRRFTVPSVAAQSCLPNAWIVFFDEGTPQQTREEFRELAVKLPLLRAEYCAEFSPQLARERTCHILPPEAEWLLTTRLDNDDALHRRFVETLQSHVRPGVREFINPTFGLILADGRLYRDRDNSNPFISFSEPVSDCHTVLIDQHPLLARHGPVRQFSLPDAWLQVVHGGNIVNAVRGSLISPSMVSPDALPTSLSGSLPNVGLGRILLYNCCSQMRGYIRRIVRLSRRLRERPIIQIVL